MHVVVYLPIEHTLTSTKRQRKERAQEKGSKVKKKLKQQQFQSEKLENFSLNFLTDTPTMRRKPTY